MKRYPLTVLCICRDTCAARQLAELVAFALKRAKCWHRVRRQPCPEIRLARGARILFRGGRHEFCRGYAVDLVLDLTRSGPKQREMRDTILLPMIADLKGRYFCP